MQQLSGLDASFLYLETPTAPMHVGGFAIYDPSTVPGGRMLRFTEIMPTSSAGSTSRERSARRWSTSR